MEVTRIRALRGPNLWSRHTAIEAVVSCDESERSLDKAFEKRLRERFPRVGALHVPRSSKPVSMAHVLEQATLALQTQAGCQVTFSRTTPTEEPGVFQVVVQYTEEAVGRLAFARAQELCRAACTGEAFDIAATLAELRDLDEDERLGPSTGAIVEAALKRGIPCRRLTRGSLVQLGWGARQRRIQAAEEDGTSAIAETIAQDKDLTKKVLHSAGVPVPLGRPAADLEDGWAVAQEVGLPVVVKPQGGNQGKGVTVGISSRAHFELAWQEAAQYGDVMVEKYLSGNDYRLLVVGNKLVAAARREPPLVIGDGKHTVRELVAEVNKDPRRGKGHGTSLTQIRIDAIAAACLKGQDLTPESVPPRGQRVILRHNANLSTGGTATDVTDNVHPDVAARAIEAALTVGLDICGVDVICESVLRPLEEQGGGIVEVNAAPGLRMHVSPSFGKGRDVGKAVIEHMFPSGSDGANGRIPLVAVTGTNGKTTTVRLTAHLLATHGLRVGMTNTDGVYANGRQIDSGDCSGPRSARNVLAHPDVDAAVLETARGGLLREGLAFDKCDVAIVTNLGAGDHLGLNYITTLEDLMVLKRVIVLNVAPTGSAVLNAADPNVVAMAARCPGSVVFFAQDGQHPVIKTHLAQGKRVVYVQDGDIVCAERGFEKRLPLSRVPITHKGLIGFQVENALASVGAAWACPGTPSGAAWPPSPATKAPCPAASTSSTTPAPPSSPTTGTTPTPSTPWSAASATCPHAAAASSSAARATGAMKTSASKPASSAQPSTTSSSTRTPASAAAPTAKSSPCCARACKAPNAPATWKKSTANSPPSTTPSTACKRAICASSSSTRCKKRSPTSSSAPPKPNACASRAPPRPPRPKNPLRKPPQKPLQKLPGKPP